jgi:hypothetical protein
MLEGDSPPIPIKGRTLIGWSQDGFWFTIASQLTFPDSDRVPYTLTSKGRFHKRDGNFSFYIDHSEIGRMEGVGWVNHQTITQQFRVLGSDPEVTGFEVLYQQAGDRYLLCRTMTKGNSMERVIEGTLTLVPT